MGIKSKALIYYRQISLNTWRDIGLEYAVFIHMVRSDKESLLIETPYSSKKTLYLALVWAVILVWFIQWIKNTQL